MKLPLRLDAEMLVVYDADGHVVCHRDIPVHPKLHAERARDLRRIVAAMSFTRFCTTDGMEQVGALPIEKVVEIESEVRGFLDAETHFSGPRGLVKP